MIVLYLVSFHQLQYLLHCTFTVPDLQQHLTYMQHSANVSLCLKVSAGACVSSLCISSVCSSLFISAIKWIKLHKIYILTIILILTRNGIDMEMVIKFIGKNCSGKCILAQVFHCFKLYLSGLLSSLSFSPFLKFKCSSSFFSIQGYMNQIRSSIPRKR